MERELLSEQQIRKIALGYLKGYYKLRPRKSETDAFLDLRTPDNIVVDGYLRFIKNDDQPFIATFEATSNEKKDEVLFQIQQHILVWDSLAVAAITTAFTFSIFYIRSAFTVKQLGVQGCVLLSLAIMSVVFLIYYLLARQNERYHYIYAVEQFKRYHADEQWIAVGYDVFEHSEDPYYLELKHQCIYNGFGLITINPKYDPVLVITPAREELFKYKRKQGLFMDRAQMSNWFTTNKYTKYWKTIFGKIRLPSWWSKQRKRWRLSEEQLSLFRYQRSFWKQIMVIFLGASILSAIFYKEWLDSREILSIDTQKYQNQVKKQSIKKEPTYWDRPDSVTIPKLKYKPIQRVEELHETPVVLPTTNVVDANRVYITFEGSASVMHTYDCTRIFNIPKEMYVIVDGSFSTEAAARKRMKVLKTAGFDVYAVWSDCFRMNAEAYVVFIDMLQDNKTKAQTLMQGYEIQMERYGIKEVPLKLITIAPPK